MLNKAMSINPVTLTQDLIRCPSVTPQEGGALDLLQKTLTDLGFRCWRLPFSEAGTPDVDNLFARLGDAAPHVCFAGHTDVVPTGDEKLWRFAPFAAMLSDGVVYGRGASDMKGAIGCFISAVSAFVQQHKKRGSISLLITGDEEGPSINGTAKVLRWMKDNNHVPDLCIVGEPTNPQRVGQMLKIGRRGYVNGEFTVKGKSGHTAYAYLARNPLPGMARAVTVLSALQLDKGTAFFEPSNLAFTSVDTGNAAENVIPEVATARFNVRFNDRHTRDSLHNLFDCTLRDAFVGTDLTYDFTLDTGAPSFITNPTADITLFEKIVKDVTSLTPERSTTGGTSDARFIRTLCPVFEFGLVNATIHQIDEHAKIADIEQLTAIYTGFLDAYLTR
jgi:succinyl-diaminopimelate desuccinylase